MARAIDKLNLKLEIVPVAIAIPSGKLCRNIPVIKNNAVFLICLSGSFEQDSGFIWGIFLSKINIRENPKRVPSITIITGDIKILSGISSIKEIESITPAANESILHIPFSEGIFKTPIKEPINGPAIEIKSI